MSWSLRLHNGDFTLGGSSLGTVVDEYKLTQDLRCALLERMGTDDMHSTFGSLIDGGLMPDGTVVPSVIGQTVQQAAATIRTEIQRLASSYKSQQLARAKSDRVAYNRISLTPAEVLLSVTNVEIDQQEDALFVTVTLSTARGEDITVVFPITNS